MEGLVKSAASVGGGVVGGGGVTVGGGYAYHKATDKTIEQVLGKDFLPSSQTTEFNKLLEILKKKEAENGYYGLKELATKESVSISDLSNWCDSQKKQSHGSNIYMNKKYVSRVSSYCIYTIKKKILEESGKSIVTLTDDSDQTTLQAAHSKMKSTNNGLEAAINAISELKSIKTQDNSKGWKALKKWCTKSIERGYKGDSDNTYKAAKDLCTKSDGSGSTVG